MVVPPRQTPRRWLAGRTLRARLIAGLVTLLFAACAAIGIVTYAGLHGFLLGQLDDQLAAASNRYAMCMNGPPPGDHQPGQDDHDSDDQGDHDDHPGNPGQCANTAGQAESTFSASIRPGMALAAYVTNGECRLTAQDKAALQGLRVNGPPATEQLSSLGGSYRLIAARGSSGEVLITGLPVSPMTDTLNDVSPASSAPAGCACRCGRCSG
jgi:two-component system OmpR family sensor kinase